MEEEHKDRFILKAPYKPTGDVYKRQVDAIAQRGRKGGFRRGVVFTFLRQIVGEQLHKAHVTRAVGMAQQMGGLVEGGDVFVLVHCAQRLSLIHISSFSYRRPSL